MNSEMTFLLGQQAPGADELYDIVVLEPVPPIWPLVFWSALGIILFIITCVAIWYFLKRKNTDPGRSAVAKVKSRLIDIEKSRTDLAPNQFSLAVSDSLKDYLSEKYDDPVRYETAQEFLKRSSETRSKLPESARPLLVNFLAECEEMKFGNKGGTDSSLLALLQRADEVVNTCEHEIAKTASPVTGSPREFLN